MKKMKVNYGGTIHGKEEIDAVINVLKTSTQLGKHVHLFEKKVSKLYSKKYSVMTNSGSSAMFLIMEKFNFAEGSEIITPLLTYSTTITAIIKNDLIPSFVDVNLNTLCIDTAKIEKSITKKTKAILGINLMGSIADWVSIRKIAKKYNLIVIEDSADTIGAKIGNRSTGYYTDASMTSFYGSHVINGAGNGGMASINSKDLFTKIKVARSWGRSSTIYDEKAEKIENRFNIKIGNVTYDRKFVFSEIGYNFEPSEISAAFGLVQLKKLRTNLDKRIKIFKKHQIFFKKYEKYFILPEQKKDIYSGWLAYPLIIKEGVNFDRKDLQIFLEKNNIQTRVIFTGNILKQPGYNKIKRKVSPYGFKNTNLIHKNGLIISLYNGLTENHLNYMYKMFDNFISKYERS
jgi:CDP-4-dehydro-6-deoxyglucose reductase, E1